MINSEILKSEIEQRKPLLSNTVLRLLANLIRKKIKLKKINRKQRGINFHDLSEARIIF